MEEIATSAEIGGYQDDLDRDAPRHDDDRARRADPARRVATAPARRVREVVEAE